MFKRTLMAASLAVAALASAQSMAAVNGGGGTLAAPFYNTSGVLPAGFAAYIGVGSGAGKLAFLNNDPSQFGLPAGTNVHWAGSDSKLASTDITTYNTNHGAAWGPLIQVPAMATAVTIPFNKAGGNLNLTTQELCGVFSGRVTDWSGIAGNGGRSGPLTVVYRSDSSGTTELFTRFLNAKCSEAGIFNVTTSFGSSYTAYPNGTIPTNFVSAVGSPAVMTALNAADSRITYMSPDLAVTATADLDNATKVATVNSIAPNLTNVGTAVSGVTAPATANRSNPNLWVPVFAATTSPTDPSVFPFPSSGYPIIGFTNMIFSQCYTDATQTGLVRSFLTQQYGAGTSANDAAVTANRFVPMSAAFKLALRQSFLTSTNAQYVGNTSVCNAIGRPL
ncbi:substrate-binding domain-containing protein [Pseudomonas gingeri]|uniref:substrate-binding domain-containing protein n=1 Tax=Pseudomonas gingeri TaxID=117681 RepID=UPI00159FC0F3|nr:substrate-binding domain-containing protein [Pseudomonas gingeri]NWA25046.1 substrate-binding domain-containing protein [Pseudomonas gingeri]NWD75962.1 substrate-binding domain-containing protein [Pseudomonas gingeri]